MQWIVENMDWLFSGLGITIISLVILFFRKNKGGKKVNADGEIQINQNNLRVRKINARGKVQINQNNLRVRKINARGKVQINQILNEANQIPDQIHITLMSLKQMPGRLQESINSGATSFSFEETRSELEKLYALAQSSGHQELASSIETFQGNYNRYLELIKLAIKGEVTLEEVNKYHQQGVVLAFESEVKL